METRLTIEDLVAKVLSELERLNYAYNTLCGFRAFYKRVIAFANEKDETYFSEELGRRFLKEKYNCTIDYYKEAMTKVFKDPIRKIRVLGDYQLHGVFIRRIVKKPRYVRPPQFQKELAAYEKECEINEYSKRGKNTPPFGIVIVSSNPLPYRRGVLYMIKQKESCNQLPKEIKPAFKELHVLKHLKDARINKKFGFTAAYLFQLVFVLLFHQKNWFRLLESEKAESFPGKDAVYRFLNHTKFAWRQFLLSLSIATVQKVERLTSDNRVTVFIFDDSMFDRNRSKAVELLARFKDHATGAYYKGFRMLTMGWSDSHSFIPMDFALLSSTKSQINGITEGIDKRTIGFKRREEAFRPAPKVIASMIDSAIAQLSAE